MSITYDILGKPGRDNTLLVKIDTGQSIYRLLFDCGDGCLDNLSVSEIMSIDHLFFSHLHMDHVSGFDSFFRCVYSREAKPNHIWGPPDTISIMQHRFQGFLWNLHHNMTGTWGVTDIHPESILTTTFELSEAFSVPHTGEFEGYELTVLDNDAFYVNALSMEHGTPTIAYVVREKPKKNIDTARLKNMGLKPGPWLKTIKQPVMKDDYIEIAGQRHAIETLQNELIVETTGDSIAYLTDFLLDETNMDATAHFLDPCNTIVCEAQYCHADLELAQKNFHMTTVLTARLARQSNAKDLILFHLSDRYDKTAWKEMLAEARTIFPNTRFPAGWEFET